MVTNPVIGNKYWCLEEAIEDASYGSYDSIKRENAKPWMGILSQSSSGCLRLHRFNEETDEIDEDTNATAYIRQSDLYDNYDEVLSLYIEQERSGIDSLKEVISDREHNLLFYEKQQKANLNWRSNLDGNVIVPKDDDDPKYFYLKLSKVRKEQIAAYYGKPFVVPANSDIDYIQTKMLAEE